MMGDVEEPRKPRIGGANFDDFINANVDKMFVESEEVDDPELIEQMEEMALFAKAGIFQCIFNKMPEIFHECAGTEPHRMVSVKDNPSALSILVAVCGFHEDMLQHVAKGKWEPYEEADG